MVKKRTKRSKTKKKAIYRVRNWAEYNKSLVERGSLTLWIDEEVIENWHPQAPEKRSRGGQVRYSDQSIEGMLLLRAVFDLTYRQTEGFGQSLMDLVGAEVQVPNYTTLCKRQADLSIRLPETTTQEPQHIVMDSTGLKIYGEGEWKVRQHGVSKRRTWRKLHLSINEATQTIEAVELTEVNVDDAEAGKQMLKTLTGQIDQVSADGAYDKRKFYDTCTECGVKQVTVPPRKNAKIWQHGNSKKVPLPRDENLRQIRRVGRQRWKQTSGYHRRSLAETAMFRFKTLLGNTLRARTLTRQINEVHLKAIALNRMTSLGMPDSYPIT